MGVYLSHTGVTDFCCWVFFPKRDWFKSVLLLVAFCVAMGKHFSPKELDDMQVWRGKPLLLSPVEVHRRISKERQRAMKTAPNLTSVRRALKGVTSKRSRLETRGRKPILSLQNLKTLDRVRDELITKADTNYEVTWDDVIRKSRVPKVDRSTAAKHMKKSGFRVQWRAPRLKPSHGEMDKAFTRRRA